MHQSTMNFIKGYKVNSKIQMFLSGRGQECFIYWKCNTKVVEEAMAAIVVLNFLV